MTTFFVPGDPHGKGRPRVTTRGGKPRAYTPEKTVAAERVVKQLAAIAIRKPMLGPVRLSVDAVFPVPKSWPKSRREAALAGQYHLSKPDGDNILKLVADALNGIAYPDDASVCEARVVKRYGPAPGMTVIVEVAA